MIKVSDIITLLVTAIDGDPTLEALWRHGQKVPRIIVGRPASEEAQAQDKRVAIAIYPGDGYNLGHVVSRSAPVGIRVGLYDNTVEQDGIRETYPGPLTVADICHQLVELARGIDCGADLQAGEVVVDSTQWPYTTATVALSFEWQVGLNQEASL